jgi:hypothetical protein
MLGTTTCKGAMFIERSPKLNGIKRLKSGMSENFWRMSAFTQVLTWRSTFAA